MIILTSSVASVAEHLHKNFLVDKNLKTILFIDTAAELEEHKEGGWLFDDLRSLEKQGYTVERYTVSGKTRESISNKVDDFDIIYMCGGNTFYLLQQLQRTGSLEIIKNKVEAGKTYIGTSAGSLIASTDITPAERIDSREQAPDLIDTKGLDLVDFLLMPHWGSEHFRDLYLERRLEKLYTVEHYKYLLLNDNQYVHVNSDGYYKVIDVRDLL